MTYDPLNPDPRTWWVCLDWLRPIDQDEQEHHAQETRRLDQAVTVWSTALQATPWAVKILETVKRRNHYTEVRHEHHSVGVQLEGAIIAEAIGEMDWEAPAGEGIKYKRHGARAILSDLSLPSECIVYLAQCASRAPHTVSLIIDEDGYGLLFVGGWPYEVRERPVSAPVLLWFDPLAVIVGGGAGRLPTPREYSPPPPWTQKPAEPDNTDVPLYRPWPYFAYQESPHNEEAALQARKTVCQWAKTNAPGSLLALMDEDYIHTPPDNPDEVLPCEVRDAFDQAVSLIADGGDVQSACEAVFTAIYAASCDRDVESRWACMVDMLSSISDGNEHGRDTAGLYRWTKKDMLLLAASWGKAMGLRRPVREVPVRR